MLQSVGKTLLPNIYSMSQHSSYRNSFSIKVGGWAVVWVILGTRLTFLCLVYQGSES